MASHDWNEITSDDVIKAIEIFESDDAKHPKARNTFLIYDGKKYPAKHIRGIAYRVRFGEEIRKDEYSGGNETARFFERLGFTIDYKHTHVDTHPNKAKVVVSAEKQ